MKKTIQEARSIDDYLTAIERLLRQGDLVVRGGVSPGKVQTTTLLSTEAALLIGAYQLFMHREVFEPLANSSDPVTRQRVLNVKIECITLADDLRRNVRDLLTEDYTQNWAAFVAKVDWFNRRMRRHIADVRSIALPALEHIRKVA